MNKADKKALKNQYLAKQKADFEQHLPFDRAKFDKLFDFLDDRLQKNKCNHGLRFTELFLQIHRIKNPKQVIDWLAEQGGYCDCEVLNNVSEHFDWVSKFESHEDDVPVALGIALKAKRKIACLDTDFGFKITHVPKPWTLKQGVQNPNEYFFQYGKGLGALFTKICRDDVWSRLMDDEFWLDKMPNSTRLERMDVDAYHIVVAISQNILATIWCVPTFSQHWYLQSHSERQRYQGDIKELQKLLALIKNENQS